MDMAKLLTISPAQSPDLSSASSDNPLVDAIKGYERRTAEGKAISDRNRDAADPSMSLAHPVAPPRSKGEQDARREKRARELQEKYANLKPLENDDPQFAARQAAMEREHQADEQRKHVKRMELLEYIGVYRRYWHIDLRKPQAPWLPESYCTAAGSLLTLIESPKTVALFGPPGTGKTALGCALVMAAVERGLKCRRQNALKILGEIYDAPFQKTWADRQNGTLDKEDIRSFYAKTVDLLVIDDIQERASSRNSHELSEIIDERYSRELATVLVTHLDGDVIEQNVGQRLYRRIEESGGGICCDWPRLETLRPALSA